jgi:hypothetical protein
MTGFIDYTMTRSRCAGSQTTELNQIILLLAMTYFVDIIVDISNDTVNVEHTLGKDSHQISRNKSLKIFYRNIRGLGNKANELYSDLHHDLPHILCSSEHLSESKLQLIHLTNYSLGTNYCGKNFLKGGVSIIVYENLKYKTINIYECSIGKDIEACAIQLDSTFNKLCILAIYRSPMGDFTIFLK